MANLPPDAMRASGFVAALLIACQTSTPDAVRERQETAAQSLQAPTESEAAAVQERRRLAGEMAAERQKQEAWALEQAHATAVARAHACEVLRACADKHLPKRFDPTRGGTSLHHLHSCIWEDPNIGGVQDCFPIAAGRHYKNGRELELRLLDWPHPGRALTLAYANVDPDTCNALEGSQVLRHRRGYFTCRLRDNAAIDWLIVD